MKLLLKNIRLDGGTQTRARINEPMLTEYAAEMKGGAVFPPLVVFYDGTDYWLADGFHRWGAAESIKLDSIECEVRSGTMEDAQWHSYSANKTNGMRRTNDDKVRAVKAALKHSPHRSNPDIARHIGVSDEMARKYRAELEAAGELKKAAHLPTVGRCNGPEVETVPGETARVVTRKGKTYQMKVGKIGKAPKPKRPGGMSPNARTPFRSTVKPEDVIPMMTISLPLNNPQVAGRAMLSHFKPDYLRSLVKAILSALEERSGQ